MVRFLGSSLLLASFVAALSLPSAAVAQDDPRVIYERCVLRVAGITERCRARNRELARACGAHITELLAVGDVEGARQLAHRCIEQIDENSNGGIRRIRELCEECVRQLRALEAFELAERLVRRCQRAIDAIEESRENSIRYILSLFHGGGSAP